MNGLRVRLGRLAVALWVGLIFFSSTSLASEWAEEAFSYLSRLLLPGVHPHSHTYDWMHLLADKGFHVALFCVLAILLWRALPNISRKILVILAFGAVVGMCSEFLQRFFPGRDPAIRDVLINIAGTALGLILCGVISERTSAPLERV
jgi:VanZ family protein